MSLQGTLESFALPDVLVLLSSTKKTGELKVNGARGEGRVWVDKGQIVHCQRDGKKNAPVDTIFELLRLESGTFSFDNDSEPSERDEPQLVDLVLTDAQGRLSEWREIEAVVPHLDAVVDMAPDAPGDEVTVTNAQWKLLVAVAGGHSVHTLMQRLERSEFDTCKAVKELVEARMATIDTNAKAAPKPAEARDAKADAKAEEKTADKPGEPAAKADASTATASLADKAEDKASEKSEKSDKGDEKADDKVAASAEKSAAKADEAGKEADSAEGSEDTEEQLSRARRVRATTSAVGGDQKSGDRKEGESPPLRSVGASSNGTGSSSVNGTGSGVKAGDTDRRGEPKDNDHKEDDTEALVAQLAALGVDEDDPEAKEKIAARLAEESAAAEGDEPINRGLLLKFLSSVRN